MSTDPSDAPYTLVQIDSSPSSPISSLSLAWHHVRVPHATKTKTHEDPSSHDEVVVLENVTGDAVAGEVLAIVGPSRVTTSSLLRVLGGRMPIAIDGTVRVNDQAVRMALTMTAYVTREIPMIPMLTVQEHLTLQAHLRLDESSTPSERATRVTSLLGEMGLSGVAMSLIGNGPQGLSPYHRKLLALATELLPHPSIVLIEEPMEGLTAAASKQMMHCLHTLARNGHTVVVTMTLDQALSSMFSIIDKLHVLTGTPGRTVFHGKPQDSLVFFKTHGFPCPALTNPFEFFQDVLSQDDDTKLAAAWTATTSHAHEAVIAVPAAETPLLESGDRLMMRPPRLRTQLAVLFRQNLCRMANDRATLQGRIRQSLIIAIAIGLVFLRLDISQLHVQSFSSTCFFTVASQFMSNLMAELFSAPNEVARVLGDHQNRLYHALNWYFVKNVIDIPVQMFYTMVFLLPLYYLVGFPNDTEVFFEFYLFAFLAVSTGVALALFASCTVPRPKAFLVGLLLGALSLVFGGPFLNRKSVPDYFIWLQQSSPAKYAYHGLMRAFWTKIDDIPCVPGGICRARNGHAVLAMNYMRPDKFQSDWQILLGINLILRAVAGLALCIRAKRA